MNSASESLAEWVLRHGAFEQTTGIALARASGLQNRNSLWWLALSLFVTTGAIVTESDSEAPRDEATVVAHSYAHVMAFPLCPARSDEENRTPTLRPTIRCGCFGGCSSSAFGRTMLQSIIVSLQVLHTAPGGGGR
ncbi:transcriptional regulator/sugar kinase [Anopheles sinensis]|uniref:Transcriptional regulator/sugar kinase n=1 Tax=Anopheles sinensis TaxID=74873 RepID=A0A084VGV6_ANOSI|nr:transcriptional regulator/sugar kinase [Anopheles sinensis]